MLRFKFLKILIFPDNLVLNEKRIYTTVLSYLNLIKIMIQNFSNIK